MGKPLEGKIRLDVSGVNGKACTSAFAISALLTHYVILLTFYVYIKD